MNLHTLSMEQALSLWSELEQAYFKKNGYGGDTAEIYIYRLMPHTPSIGTFENLAVEAYDCANQAMYELLAMFAEDRDAVIMVAGRELGEWLKTARYHHRVHVRVLPRKGP